MTYYTLQAQTGYLWQEESIEPDLATKAQDFATLMVDSEFEDWDRTTWTGSGIPNEIADVAELFGTAKYMELAAIRGGPESDTKKLAEEIMTKAHDTAHRIRNAGGPWDAATGLRIAPKTSDGGARFLEMYPT
ncbi:MAG TPA: hypothetical protein ENK43_04400 [Planctomycetes bacterium]|nr:hypothetical protein [Planctomycetota bacterium]